MRDSCSARSFATLALLLFVATNGALADQSYNAFVDQIRTSEGLIDGKHIAFRADFSVPLPESGIVADLSFVLSPEQACEAIINPEVAGTIVLIKAHNKVRTKGEECTYVQRAKRVQDAGGVAMLVVSSLSSF